MRTMRNEALMACPLLEPVRKPPSTRTLFPAPTVALNVESITVHVHTTARYGNLDRS